MVEGMHGVGRRCLTGEMKRPFGRGVNFQWDIIEIDSFYSKVKLAAPDTIYLDLETQQYQTDEKVIIQKQFIVMDPNGYLFRFCSAV